MLLIKAELIHQIQTALTQPYNQNSRGVLETILEVVIIQPLQEQATKDSNSERARMT